MTYFDFVEAHHRALFHHAPVGGESKQTPAGDRRAVDRGHHRLLEREDIGQHRREVQHEGAKFASLALRQGNEIETRAEQLRMRRGKENRLHGRLAAHGADGGGKIEDQFLTHRVATRTCETDRADPVLDLNLDCAHARVSPYVKRTGR
jgi:hypothetical protein